MSTWGQKKIKVNKYYDSPELYYHYSTSTDVYHFIETGIDNQDGTEYEEGVFFSCDIGEAMMEGFISHILAFKNLTEEEFCDRYIKNNRFRS